MDELLKDLTEYLQGLSIVGDLGEPPTKVEVEFGDGDIYEVNLADLAVHLEGLGYVKVTECKDCRYNDRCIILAGMCDQIQFCSLGESKEGPCR